MSKEKVEKLRPQAVEFAEQYLLPEQKKISIESFLAGAGQAFDADEEEQLRKGEDAADTFARLWYKAVAQKKSGDINGAIQTFNDALEFASPTQKGPTLKQIANLGAKAFQQEADETKPQETAAEPAKPATEKEKTAEPAAETAQDMPADLFEGPKEASPTPEKQTQPASEPKEESPFACLTFEEAWTLGVAAKNSKKWEVAIQAFRQCWTVAGSLSRKDASAKQLEYAGKMSGQTIRLEEA